jgi:hypothetical protein
MRFFGRLAVDGERSNWLRAEVGIDHHRMVLAAGGHELGSWPLSSVRAERLEEDRFDLHLGAERALFAADDAVAFSYEALPLMGKGLSVGGMVSKVRTAFAHHEEASGTDSVEQAPKVRALVADEGMPLFPELVPLGAERHQPAPEPSRLRMLVAAARQADPRVEERDERIFGDAQVATPVDPPRSEEPVEEAPEQLKNLYELLDEAIGDVRSGRITPDQGIAIAELAKAACLAVYAHDDSHIEDLAARLLASTPA